MVYDKFHGIDLSRWLSHFRFGKEIQEYLELKGVKSVQDLLYFYSDEKIMRNIHDTFGMEYQKLIDVFHCTQLLVDSPLLPSMLATLIENVGPRIPLEKLSAKEVAAIIEYCELNSNSQTMNTSYTVIENNISGNILNSCDTVADIQELDITGQASYRTKALYNKVVDWKKYGVPSSYFKKSNVQQIISMISPRTESSFAKINSALNDIGNDDKSDDATTDRNTTRTRSTKSETFTNRNGIDNENYWFHGPNNGINHENHRTNPHHPLLQQHNNNYPYLNHQAMQHFPQNSHQNTNSSTSYPPPNRPGEYPMYLPNPYGDGRTNQTNFPHQNNFHMNSNLIQDEAESNTNSSAGKKKLSNNAPSSANKKLKVTPNKPTTTSSSNSSSKNKKGSQPSSSHKSKKVSPNPVKGRIKATVSVGKGKPTLTTRQKTIVSKNNISFEITPTNSEGGGSLEPSEVTTSAKATNDKTSKSSSRLEILESVKLNEDIIQSAQSHPNSSSTSNGQHMDGRKSLADDIFGPDEDEDEDDEEVPPENIELSNQIANQEAEMAPNLTPVIKMNVTSAEEENEVEDGDDIDDAGDDIDDAISEDTALQQISAMDDEVIHVAPSESLVNEMDRKESTTEDVADSSLPYRYPLPASPVLTSPKMRKPEIFRILCKQISALYSVPHYDDELEAKLTKSVTRLRKYVRLVEQNCKRPVQIECMQELIDNNIIVSLVKEISLDLKVEANRYVSLDILLWVASGDDQQLNSIVQAGIISSCVQVINAKFASEFSKCSAICCLDLICLNSEANKISVLATDNFYLSLLKCYDSSKVCVRTIRTASTLLCNLFNPPDETISNAEEANNSSSQSPNRIVLPPWSVCSSIISCLMNGLRKKTDPITNEMSLMVITSLIWNSIQKTSIQSFDAITEVLKLPILSTFLTNFSQKSRHIQLHTYKMLSVLCSGDDDTVTDEILKYNDFLPTLRHSLRMEGSSMHLLEEACILVGKFTAGPARHIQELCDSGVMELVVNCIGSDVFEVIKASTLAVLSTMKANSTNELMTKVLSYGLCEQLRRLLTIMAVSYSIQDRSMKPIDQETQSVVMVSPKKKNAPNPVPSLLEVFYSDYPFQVDIMNGVLDIVDVGEEAIEMMLESGIYQRVLKLMSDESKREDHSLRILSLRVILLSLDKASSQQIRDIVRLGAIEPMCQCHGLILNSLGNSTEVEVEGEEDHEVRKEYMNGLMKVIMETNSIQTFISTKIFESLVEYSQRKTIPNDIKYEICRLFLAAVERNPSYSQFFVDAGVTSKS